MNPLTQVKNTQKITSREVALGISEDASWHSKYRDSAYIFVGGIPFDLTEGDLLAVFAQYGEIVDVNLVRDKGTGKSKGFAFVAYEDQRSTNLAVDNLNGAQILGRIIRVDHVSNYKKKEEEDEEAEQQKREERGVCRAFQRGECTRGASCKFSHNEERARNTGWGPQDTSARWGHDKFDGSKKGQVKDWGADGRGTGSVPERRLPHSDRGEEKKLKVPNKGEKLNPEPREDLDSRVEKTSRRRHDDVENKSRGYEDDRDERRSRRTDYHDELHNTGRDYDRKEEKRSSRHEVKPRSRDDYDRGDEEGPRRHSESYRRENRDKKGNFESFRHGERDPSSHRHREREEDHRHGSDR